MYIRLDLNNPVFFVSVNKRCVIENFRHFFGVNCEMAIVIANVLGFAFLFFVVLIVIIFIKCRSDIKHFFLLIGQDILSKFQFEKIEKVKL